MRPVMFILMTSFTINLYAAQTSGKNLLDLEALTARTFCNDQATLSYIGENYEACMTYISSISKDCVTKYNNAISDFESVEEYLKRDVLVTSLAELYFTCVKATIFENRENVILLKNLSKNGKREPGSEPDESP